MFLQVLGVTCLPPLAGKSYRQISSPRPIAAHHATLMRAPPATTTAARSGPMRTSCGGCISTLVVDFDSTCTQHDSTSLYGQLAAEEADARQEWEKGAAIRKAWEEAGRMYAKQYNETMTQALPEVRISRNFDFPSLEIVTAEAGISCNLPAGPSASWPSPYCPLLWLRVCAKWRAASVHNLIVPTCSF